MPSRRRSAGGRGEGRHHVTTRRCDGWAQIRIQDTGAGFPAAVQPRIFDPFFTTKPVGRGTGQGLAICHPVIVEKHGGRISFESEVGRGTTFTVELPLAGAGGGMTGPRPSAVLFVDDEPLLLQGLQRMLRSQRAAWTMRFAGSGREALERLAQEPFDALVTDLRMPGMSGEELLRAVQERHPQLVRIILSGEMDSAASFPAVHCAHRYLAKPCEAEELKSALSQALALRRWVEAHPLKGLWRGSTPCPACPRSMPNCWPRSSRRAPAFGAWGSWSNAMSA
jgi:CheY-like chemotaxis protein